MKKVKYKDKCNTCAVQSGLAPSATRTRAVEDVHSVQ